jgi:hypothetical protein
MWAVSVPTAAAQAARDHETRRPRLPGTPEEIERQRYEQVYTGRATDVPAHLARGADGPASAACSLTNLYIGLKAAGFGVAITACILSYAI